VGSEVVDQIRPSGQVVIARDVTLNNVEKERLLLRALPGAVAERYAGVRVVRFRDQIILKKQVTHLGKPHPNFKKRIQIPPEWLEVHEKASSEGLTTRFVGIYHFGSVTIFVDFDPSTYLLRKANNSAAHVSTNDLFQAQRAGQFSRVDRNGNRLTSVRSDAFATYLRDGGVPPSPWVDVFRDFNAAFLRTGQLQAITAVQEMHAASWPDRFQSEWPGFYLEFRFDSYLCQNNLEHLIEYQKNKKKAQYDYDLRFKLSTGRISNYGDLKASDVAKCEAPGNDAKKLAHCLEKFRRFWYVIYEHETTCARDNGDKATRVWNELRRSLGHIRKGGYNPLSYKARFKESVRFVKMSILELNQANASVVLGEFKQGRQPDGASRALKVMIKKRNIDNFLIYSE
jgi:hypothetical protein